MSQRFCLWSAVVALSLLAGCGSTATTQGPTDLVVPPESKEAVDLCRKLRAHVVMDVTSIEFLPESNTENTAAPVADPPSKVDDATLEKVGALSQLRSLYLVGSNITDAGLAHLKGLEKLETLDLSNSAQVSDAGLEHLKEIRSLRKLIIRGCGQITVPGREALREHFKKHYGVSQLLITGP
jgi:hypothetical protein